MKLELTPTERRVLRAEAHGKNPVVMIGQNGLTDAVIREIAVNLDAHELIKIRVFSDEREVRVQLFEDICNQLDAAQVQHIGKLLVIYRPHPENPKISLTKQNLVRASAPGKTASPKLKSNSKR
ncbi:ribosome assembly RNA-binding protein YhbY [Leeia sp. TBRC 13508]|uniref:Ribosome assembly RNA-binding protein YhbY n=1 Tax=Leeia speluncae TaxID=2884804 RepID=A0ABS8D2Q2_9NEIS|nr:ribosome assembly RNA-binding protein YhbY [Leeia speluncae]MCB6182263.1 ribosome assembly RNA-binding protein YhbY [Leeia speluncae]